LRGPSRHQRLVVAVPWLFPAPSSVLPVTRWTLEGIDSSPSSSLRRSRVGAPTLSTSPLRSPSELRSLAPVGKRPSSLGIRPVRAACRASLPDPHLVRPPRPSIDMLSRRPLPARCRHRTFGPWSTRPGVPFRPRGFAPPRRFSPPPAPEWEPAPWGVRVAGLLHPAADHGVRLVSSATVLLPGHPLLPRDVSYPSKDSPHLQPYRVTTASAFLTFHRRAARASGVSRCRSIPSARLPPRARLQGFALRMSPYRRMSLPTHDGLPSRGLLVPLQGPSLVMDRLAPMSHDGRPVRFRGAVSVPIAPAPTGSTAAPLSSLVARRPDDRGYASLRCPPRRRDPSRFEPTIPAEAGLVGRHVHAGEPHRH